MSILTYNEIQSLGVIMLIAVLVPYGCRGEALGPKVPRLFLKRGMPMSERGVLRESQGGIPHTYKFGNLHA